jgi:hypothetical protein
MATKNKNMTPIFKRIHTYYTDPLYNGVCSTCKNKGYFSDDLSGGESYCRCEAGQIRKQVDPCDDETFKCYLAFV